MKISIFYITYPNKKTAISISKKLIKKKLIACYNLHKIKSGYFWDGQFQNDDEWVSILKTTPKSNSNIYKFLQDHHPYDIPCIMNGKIKVNAKYGDWIKSKIK